MCAAARVRFVSVERVSRPPIRLNEGTQRCRFTWTFTSSATRSTLDDVAKAHAADLQTQGEFGVRYLRYWVAEPEGTIFCLVDAPNEEAAHDVHCKAHGLKADEIFAVTEGA